MKKLRKFLVIFIFSFLAVMLPLVSQAQPLRTESLETHSVEILDAYYIEMDIFASLSVSVQTQATTENYYLEVILINPIGDEVSFILKIVTRIEHLTLDIVFYDHATVSGDYTIIATIISNNRWYAHSDILVFDPPSGGSEGDPYIGITIY